MDDNVNVIVKMRFGSHLYGTNTPDSDTDYKGVFIPSTRDVLLGNIPKSINNSTGKQNKKNNPGDIDEEIYSLHYFVKLACAGETAALDMLHAPLGFVEHYTNTWKYLVDNKQKFYTKNLKAFVGYARRQAAKYGVKGSRLNAANQVIDIIKSEIKQIRNYHSTNDGFLGTTAHKTIKTLKLSSVWNKLPIGEHLRFVEDSPQGKRQYEVCGRILQESVSIEYAYSQVKIFYDRYGERAKLAAENRGIDFKAVSHALRAAYQVKELLIDNTITFPRPEAKFLLEVKQGKLHYKNEIEPILDNLITEVDVLAEKSNLPDKVDRNYWNDFIVSSVGFELLHDTKDSEFIKLMDCL